MNRKPILRNHGGTVLDAFRPSLIRLTDNLTAAAFPLMKIYPAFGCLQQGIENGQIGNDTHIVESSSGTMALGLAIACRWTGHQLTIVSDYGCDPSLQMRLRDLGVHVEIVERPSVHGGYQRARLDRVDEIRQSNSNNWWANQYGNPSNGKAYSKFAAQLVEAIGRIDCLVGTVGSGGSVCGTASYLRLLFPELTVVGVDTFNSVLFGQPDGTRILRGLGNSIMPANLDHTAFDEVHWLGAAEAYTATRLLHRKTALFRGGTSGACWHVARHWAEQHPNLRIVCLFPDDGHRYIQSIYDDTYMSSNQLWLDQLPGCPREVRSPLEAVAGWSWMKWGRRTYEEVIGEFPPNRIQEIPLASPVCQE